MSNQRNIDIQSAIDLLKEEGYEVKEPVKQKKITVMEFYYEGTNMNGHKEFLLETNEPIPEEKFPLIKQAIDNCLNNEGKDFFKELNEMESEKRSIKYGMYTQTQLNEARKEAFEASRLFHPLAGAKFDTAEDYIKSLKQ